MINCQTGNVSPCTGSESVEALAELMRNSNKLHSQISQTFPDLSSDETYKATAILMNQSLSLTSGKK